MYYDHVSQSHKKVTQILATLRILADLNSAQPPVSHGLQISRVSHWWISAARTLL